MYDSDSLLTVYIVHVSGFRFLSGYVLPIFGTYVVEKP